MTAHESLLMQCKCNVHGVQYGATSNWNWGRMAGGTRRRASTLSWNFGRSHCGSGSHKFQQSMQLPSKWVHLLHLVLRRSAVISFTRSQPLALVLSAAAAFGLEGDQQDTSIGRGIPTRRKRDLLELLGKAPGTPMPTHLDTGKADLQNERVWGR
ncbi:hypothetical protein B0H34DRAFT_452549 [Crassisporium funariophilum]|nr:hypothetical protein B0H34DRAFT_452549 [Crassisporium funariophilum]